MAQAPERRCDRCRGLYRGRCENCKPKRTREKRSNATQRGYGRQWRKTRAAHLAAEPLCRECKRNGQTVAASVVDHIVPHRGDRALFDDPTNRQSLCATCHNRKTARGE